MVLNALKRSVLAGIAFLAYLSAGPLAHAVCSCQEDQSSPEQQVLSALQGADYVALVHIKHTDLVETIQENDISELSLVAEFVALRVFKGPDAPMWATTPANDAGCGIEFKPGETYLIYATQLGDLSQVSTNRCMRAVQEADSARDIEILEQAARNKVVTVPPYRSHPQFIRAMGLIHAYAGCGDYRWQDPEFQDGLSEAASIAEALAVAEPQSGSSQALAAEIMSLWHFDADAGVASAELLEAVVTLSDESLRLSPENALAHVARARAYAKSYDTMRAMAEIQKALEIDPLLDIAMLTQADIYRSDGNPTKAEQWIRTFIGAVREPVRKANGHEWLGRMWRDMAYYPQVFDRGPHLLKAKAEFEESIGLDPKDPWRLINLATLLNEHLADFSGAVTYAQRALELEELMQARYQLAAARYQALQTQAVGMEANSLRAAIADIETSTGVSLDRLVKSGAIRDVVQVRLLRLQRSVHPAS